MAAAITYDGLASTTGGTIFKDMVFWVARRIPIRNEILGHIQNNGGVVVPLEKDAHILIADRARKDAPPDSYNWTYIIESVENGIAQLTDRYRIWGHPETTNYRNGAHAMKRAARTPFTPADDAALANWVLIHSSNRFGNKIYQEFAETHPWHSWQSWRERFVKRLTRLPAADLEKLAISAASQSVQASGISSRQTGEATPTQVRVPPVEERHTPQKSVGKQSVATPLRSFSTPLRQMASASKDDVGSAPKHVQQQRKGSTSPATADDTAAHTQSTMRDSFYRDFLVFVEEVGLEFDPRPIIDGRTIDLWDLCQAVVLQKVPSQEVDWMKVAEDMAFDWVENRKVPGDLRRCYLDNLADFFDAMATFINDDEDLGTDEVWPEPLQRQSLALPSPTVPRSGQKRQREDESNGSTGGVQKRRRFDEMTEIPSTPDEKIGVLATQSPSFQRTKQQVATGKVVASMTLPSSLGVDQEPDESTNAVEVVLGMHTRATPRLGAQQSTLDVTPSQQLHSEALNTNPIPLDLKANSHSPKPQRETARRPSKRWLPASFQPSSRQSISLQEADRRAQQPAQPVRIEISEEGNSQKIQECVDHYESLGYPRAIVVESLMRTTMTPGWPATLVMDMLKDKKGVPTNYEGVWTDRDDKSLRYADAIGARKSPATTRELSKAKKELDRIVNKHTLEGVNLRRQFLVAQEGMV